MPKPNDVVTIVPKDVLKPPRRFVATVSNGPCEGCAGRNDRELCFALPSCFATESEGSHCVTFKEIR